jgi:cellobiose-specific phosphotransferase system component IIA
MLRKDLIVRQFEAFGKALALIMGLRKQNDWDTFEKELREATEKYAGQPLDRLEAMSDADWQTWLLANEPERNKIVAALLYERMMHCDHLQLTAAANQIGKRCLELYLKIQNDLVSDEFNLDVHYKLQALQQRDFN